MNCCRKKVSESYISESKRDKHETTERGYWSRDIEFLLTCIGCAVGLGNIWRFPYLCMRNGGGAFLIPYFMFMIIAGIPLCLMEIALGQFSNESATTVFKICPLFSGIGWGILLINFIIMIYYNTIIAWVIYYLAYAFKSWEPLWSKCDNEWNTEFCRLPGVSAKNLSYFTNNSTHLNASTQYDFNNISVYNSKTTDLKTHSAGEEFWQFHVLNKSAGIGDLGNLRWQLVLCLFAAWVIVFLCVIKGFKSSGKVVYVTATLPYIFLTIILIRGLTLPGSLEGILFFISPDWDKMLSFQVWCEACLQIFYSLGPGWGVLITMSSYNRFHHNFYRDAVIFPIVNCCTSFFAGFVVFSIIGHIAHEGNVSVSEAITSGPGLAFVAYPEALSKIPGAAIWSVLFFFMLLTVGLDSQFVFVETVVSGIIDKFPGTLQSRRLTVLTVAVVAAFLVGLIFVSEAGVYWFQIVDWYSCSFTVLVIAILECVIVCFIYGIDRFYCDIKLMLGKSPFVLWKVCWCFLTPVALLIFLLYSYINLKAPTYGGYSYPGWAVGFGWSLAALSCLPILCALVKELIVNEGNLIKRLKRACKPDSTWGPKIDQAAMRQHDYQMTEDDAKLVQQAKLSLIAEENL
ncbi:sodium- and chloride-dependent glycine transporter 1-like [Tubulanus polymorphus]|uniref:sodium- and chloride-dependent glycine transporter 1-like n=1 Tax=Tubulanus polymorphus TaxID=672921 RepID=UPI003DA54A3D